MESPTTNGLFDFRIAPEAEWLHMMMLDTNTEDHGACTLQYDGCVRGMCQGDLHLAGSGVQCIGSRKPTTGLRNACDVMQEDVGFVFPVLIIM